MVKISSQPPGIWLNINWSVLIFWPSSASATNALVPVQGLMWQQVHSLLSLHSQLALDDTSLRDSPWSPDQRQKDWFLGKMCLFVYLYFFTLSCVCLSRAAQTDLNTDKSWFGEGHVGVRGLVPVTVWRLVCMVPVTVWGMVCPIKDLNSMWRPRTLQHYTMSRV